MNKLYLGDCLEEMILIPKNSIDLTVTSPPYDNLREYNGNNKMWGEHIWKAVIKDLYRITKIGGVVVWVVGDATIKGSETGTSFKQALWAKECGFNLHDTMIYKKQNPIPLTHKRYEQGFEYMFIFNKKRVKTFNPIMIKCKTKGLNTERRTFYQKADGVLKKGNKNKPVKNVKQKNNVWKIPTYSGKYGHPAIFPEKLAHDHIISWSNENDTVFDPFMGSGTTGAIAKELKRNFIGIELSSEYFKIAEKRIRDVDNSEQE